MRYLHSLARMMPTELLAWPLPSPPLQGFALFSYLCRFVFSRLCFFLGVETRDWAPQGSVLTVRVQKDFAVRG